MAKKPITQVKKKSKENGSEQTQYIMSQNPFDFQIAEDKTAYSTRTPFSVYYNDPVHSIRLLMG